MRRSPERWRRSPGTREAEAGSEDRFYREGLAAGGRDNSEPGVRADHGPTYHAALLYDPDSNDLEAVFLKWDKSAQRIKRRRP